MYSEITCTVDVVSLGNHWAHQFSSCNLDISSFGPKINFMSRFLYPSFSRGKSSVHRQITMLYLNLSAALRGLTYLLDFLAYLQKCELIYRPAHESQIAARIFNDLRKKYKRYQWWANLK